MSLFALQLQQVPSVELSDDLEMRPEFKRVVGGATSCVFTMTHSLLLSDTEYMRAADRLVELRSRRELPYRSLMDLLFCELFPEWRDPCRWFYDDYGPCIGEYLTLRSIRLYDAAMVVALEFARRAGDDTSLRTWQTFRARFYRELPRLIRG